jgi:WS/DGAT/MGAT family acyltransferase
MPQKHLDRLTAVDASFLVQEKSNSHMHIGALIVVEGDAPPFEEFVAEIESRLHMVPRYRQKLAWPPGDSGRPLWVDDPNFNIAYHVRHTALPQPGSEEQLLNLAARIASQQLDRSKPLWEMWVVEGLEGNRFAVINKTHHALVDGVSGVDLATVLFDLEIKPASRHRDVEPWTAHPEPSSAEMLAAGLRDAARGVFGIASRVLKLAQRPEKAVDEVRDALEGVGEFAWAGLNPAPDTPLNVEIGPHRRFAISRGQLADFKIVKNAFGGTVNDVVLTVVSGSIRKWMHSRGVRTEGLELRALVPVSIRSNEERGEFGNRIAVMRGPLPVYIKDPVARLRFIKKAMDGLKESKQAVGAEVLAGVQQLAPPTVLAQASRINFSTRLFNLIVTNVPGPQFPLYVLGHRLLNLYPIAFLPQNHSLSIAIMSYDGELNFGLLADYDAMPDVEEIATGISESLAELVELANKKTGAQVKQAAAAATAPKKVAVKKPKAKKPVAKSDSPKPAPLTKPKTPKAAAKPKTVTPPSPLKVPSEKPKMKAAKKSAVAKQQKNGKVPDGNLPSLGLPSAGTSRSASGPAAEMRAARREARQTRTPANS